MAPVMGALAWLIGVAMAAALGCGKGAGNSTGNGPASGATGDANSTATANSARIVSLDAATTETLFALGVGNRLIGRDFTSTFPAAAEAVPVLGKGRSIPAEAVLAANPSVVIGAENPTQTGLVEQLKSAGITVVTLDSSATFEAAKARIRTIAATVGQPEAGEKLVAAIDADLKTLREKIAARDANANAPRVVAVYLRGTQHAFIMGADSGMGAMIAHAGAVNALPDLTGNRPLNAEGLVAAQPDAVLLMAHGVESVGGVDGVANLQGMAETPAGRARRFIAIDDHLIGSFGPRCTVAALALHRALFEQQGTVIIDGEAQ